MEGLTREAAETALFGTSVLFAPIRHHSPACAWALRAMIREHRPEVVLIEAPADLEHHARHLADPETRFPVAVVALGDADATGLRSLRFFPFSEHAPETVAILEAGRIGAAVRFIDLPSGARLASDAPPPAFDSEAPFNAAAFIGEACARLGLRDGAELWDHLFETRLGLNDWRGFFADAYAYCAAIRATTPPALLAADDTSPREATMRAHVAAVAGRRAVVVTGGFHTPALLGHGGTEAPAAAPAESYLVAYGEEALDALSGYAAGLRYPAWYAALWRAALASEGPPDWDAQAIATAQGFARAQAARGRPVALPQVVEMLAVASGLARLKGRGAILLPDLFDGPRTALVKGEAGPGEPFAEAFHHHLRGTGLGRAPHAAGQPPLVADARARARAAGFDLSTSDRRVRRLDIRRKAKHAEASRLCHQMALIDAGFATLVAGPDFVGGHHLGLLHEEWEAAWSPFVEGRLIEAARLGATLADAAAARLAERRRELVAAGGTRDVPALLGLLLAGLRAGLGARLPPLADDLVAALAAASDLAPLAKAMRRLQGAAAPGDPLHDPTAPDLLHLAGLAFDRAVHLCGDLPRLPGAALGPAIDALGVIAGALRGPDAARFDAGRFDRALLAAADDPDAPPLLAGAVLGLLVQAGLCGPERLAASLAGGLKGVGRPPEARAAALDGLLRVAPDLLWQSEEVLRTADEALASLDDDAFLASLAPLRRSLARLNPHETDRLAHEVAARLGVAAGALTAPSCHARADVERGLRLDRAVARTLAADGLADWGAP